MGDIKEADECKLANHGQKPSPEIMPTAKSQKSLLGAQYQLIIHREERKQVPKASWY